MRPRALKRLRLIPVLAVAASIAGSASAQASSGTWERLWGEDVIAGAPVDAREVCTVASTCKAGENNFGTGGAFDEPYDTATDAAGNVWVADAGFDRIQKFTPAGEFILAVGGNVDAVATGTVPGSTLEVCVLELNCQPGSGTGKGGEFDTPTAIALDSVGNVYVADRDNNRVQKFGPTGSFIYAIGGNVDAGAGTGAPLGGSTYELCSVAGNCQAGSIGTKKGGELSGPSGVATNGLGNLFVAEEPNHRIHKFNIGGAFGAVFGKDVDGVVAGSGFEVCVVAADCKQGDFSTAQGREFAFPQRIDTDAAGDLYVADEQNHRIQKLDSSGNFLFAFGKDVIKVGATVNTDLGNVFEVCTAEADCKKGASDTALGGELQFPAGVAVDGAGSIYTTDTYNHRVQKFGPSGAFIAAWGKDVIKAGATVNADLGNVFEVCTAAQDCKTGVVGGPTAKGGEFHFPQGLGADAAGVLYVADNGVNRIQKFADPAVQDPVVVPPASGPTGLRAAALKKCKKKKTAAAKKKCKKKAKKLPL